MQLWRDLRDLHGFRGSHGSVSRWVAANRSLCPPMTAKKPIRGRPPNVIPQEVVPKFRTPSARTATWLLTTDRDRLDADQVAFIEQLLAICPEAKAGQYLTLEFQRMLRERDSRSFDGWLASIDAHPLPEFTTFAAGLRRDEAAVRAALSLPYSNGQVEGQITRLKFIKRSMYGHANFELLRRRILAA
jgi:transposase